MRPAWLAVVLPLVEAVRFTIHQGSNQTVPQNQQDVLVAISSDPVKTDKLVFESSDMDPWILASTPQFCPGTSEGASKIRCEFDDVRGGFKLQSLRFKLKYGDPWANRTTRVNFTLASYNMDTDSGQLTEVGLTWSTVTWIHGDTSLQAETAGSQDEAEAEAAGSIKEAEAAGLQKRVDTFPQPRTIEVSALPKAEDEQGRLGQFLKWADFQPTGFFYLAGQSVQVNVSGVGKTGPSPEILIGTPNLINPEDPSSDEWYGLESLGPLEDGYLDFLIKKGGIVYIRYVYDDGAPSPPPVTITLAGTSFQPFPFFRQGVTTDDQWLAMLRETTAPFAEHAGERVILTGLAVEALKHAERGQNQQELLDTYKDIIAAQDAISGLDPKAQNARDRPSPLRPMVVQANANWYAFALNYTAAIGENTTEDIWWEPALRRSWKVWHELGHHRQQTTTWSWSTVEEVTVNIYTLAARRLVHEISSDDLEHSTVEEWDQAKIYLAKDASQKDFEQQDHFTRLVMFEQLRVVFGDEFYHELHKRSRAAPQLQANDKDKKHYFMTQAAEIVQKNLTPFFTSWGLDPEQRTVDEMGKQPNTNEDFTNTPVFGGQ